jgi:hypothetical protein
MPLAAQIRAQIARYLTGAITLNEFQEWFVPEAWVVEASSPAYDLAQTIELLLAEYTSGHRTQDELREALGALTVSVTVHTAPAMAMASSAVIARPPVTVGRREAAAGRFSVVGR